MLSWIKCSWDQTGKQDWGNVFDIRGKQSLTLFKSDCWCIKRYAHGGGSRQLKIPTQDSSNMVCKAGSCLGWQLPPHTFKDRGGAVCTKSMEHTNRNSFALANSEKEAFPRVEIFSTWAWNFSDAVKQKLISFGISSMRWLGMSFKDRGQTNNHSLWLSKLYASNYLLYKIVGLSSIRMDKKGRGLIPCICLL